MKNEVSSFFFVRMKQEKPFFIYLFVGLFSAFIDTLCLYFLSDLLHVGLDLSVTVAFVSGLIINYILHSLLTFKRKIGIAIFIKYLTVVALNYFLTLLFMRLLVNILGFDLLVSKIITLPFIAVVGYILSKIWIYKI